MKDKVNEITISYHGDVQPHLWHKITQSKDAANLLFEHWDKDTLAVKESFKILLLNNDNKVKGIYEISQGGMTSTLVDLRILFAVILKSLTLAIVLAHNHPSGKLKASEADMEITRKIKQAAMLFDVKVLDHIILTPQHEYFSFADNGLL